MLVTLCLELLAVEDGLRVATTGCLRPEILNGVLITRVRVLPVLSDLRRPVILEPAIAASPLLLGAARRQPCLLVAVLRLDRLSPIDRGIFRLEPLLLVGQDPLLPGSFLLMPRDADPLAQEPG